MRFGQIAEKSCDLGRSGGETESQYAVFLPNCQVIDTVKLPDTKSTFDEFFLKEKYIKEGLSSKEISLLTFSSRATVTNHLNKLGIPLKKATRRTTGAHVFGFRKYAGKSIKMQKEQEVIELITTFRRAGYSYQKIADVLNEDSIETKTKKGFWYSKVIRQIVLRRSSEVIG